ncbi:hypothetical protein [Cupriavidus pauculus]|uniref:hypothetical protein n=1 Tax=Cupriavidus pauculus TaxID=82633 RepID=UPI0038579F94
MTTRQAKPWYKEPWPWILMSGPLLAIVGCGITIWLAIAHADVPVSDATRRGLVVQKIDTERVSSTRARHP